MPSRSGSRPVSPARSWLAQKKNGRGKKKEKKKQRRGHETCSQQPLSPILYTTRMPRLGSAATATDIFVWATISVGAAKQMGWSRGPGGIELVTRTAEPSSCSQGPSIPSRFHRVGSLHRD